MWTWVALDADTKLVPSYRVGPRDLPEPSPFMNDLSGGSANRVQLTTDGHVLLRCRRGAFGNDVDYAQLIKVYGRDDEPQAGAPVLTRRRASSQRPGSDRRARPGAHLD